MGALLGLIPIIGQLFGFASTITGAINSPLAGSILTKAAEIAERIFGTRDPGQIQAQIELDKVKADQYKAELDAATKSEQAYYADVQSARTQTVALAQSGSLIAWGAPLMSGLITVSFLIVLIIFTGWALQLPEFQQSVVTVLLGYLGAAFQQAVNYWLGSSRDSKDKTNVLSSIALSKPNAPIADGNGDGRMFK